MHQKNYGFAHKNLVLFCTTVVLTSLLIAAGVLFADDKASDELIGVSFVHPLNDKQLVDFTKSYSAKPITFYFVTGDLFGSRNFDQEKDIQTNLQALRATIVKMQKSARSGAILKAQVLAGKISPKSFGTDEDSWRDAAYILHRYKTSLEIERETVARVPLVYSIELLVPIKNAESIRRDSLVSAVRPSESKLTKRGVLRVVAAPERPAALVTAPFYESEYQDHSKLYADILDLSKLSQEDLAK